MATVIFDFDDTLYDTERLKKDIKKVLSSYNIKKKDISSSYKAVRGNLEYSFDKHLIEISKKYKDLDVGKILQNLNKLFSNSYLFPESKKILTKLKRHHTILLLTIGEEKVQKRKIETSGIKNFFDKIHITQKDKANFLKNLNLKGEVYFINDKADENKKVRAAFPHFKIVEKKHGKSIVLPMV